MRNKYSSKGLHIQGFSMIVGIDLKSITSSYFVLDGRPILLDSPKRAMEVAFKSYFTLFSNFPAQSARQLIILKKALFDMNVHCPDSLK